MNGTSHGASNQWRACSFGVIFVTLKHKVKVIGAGHTMPDTHLIEDGSNSMAIEALHWPNDDLSRIPDWIYTSEDILVRERERIFLGKCWNFILKSL